MQVLTAMRTSYSFTYMYRINSSDKPHTNLLFETHDKTSGNGFFNLHLALAFQCYPILAPSTQHHDEGCTCTPCMSHVSAWSWQEHSSLYHFPGDVDCPRLSVTNGLLWSPHWISVQKPLHFTAGYNLQAVYTGAYYRCRKLSTLTVQFTL